MVKRVVIMGAAGRDFHNFNTVFRNNEDYCVIAFTAAQIPDIEDRRYPGVLAGRLYPAGVPIYPEEDIVDIIEGEHIDVVVFSYSDVSYKYVMHRSALTNAAGADFWLIGPNETMLKSEKPVIAVCGVRTGSGKSQTTRRVAEILTEAGKRVVIVRHPMPYGDLTVQEVQRFAEYGDLDKHDCTIEEREEYEPHLKRGNVVYAGVDYEKILRQAESESDFVLWDGGNNDFPFYVPDLHITVVDPHRPGHELVYYPGEVNLLMADVLVINKMGTAEKEGIEEVKANIAKYNPKATVVEADSPLTVSEPDAIKGKKVLVVEDGPTLTHGGMKYGAGFVAARQFGAAEIIDPRPYLIGSLKETFEEYPEIGTLLPAMGYGDEQVHDLQATINNTPCDVVVSGTPINLTRLVNVNKPVIRVQYELETRSKPDLEDILKEKFAGLK
jgi:predicted GTPase